ncbi:SusD/RagB family nutrient-binding outer membrane lipoprotein [Foetidibacter luteolus]|uniref:SusD/RagB family nutrient-binding outer membrane lipoprotein n=1 Tax=Foetidibacter luteolus TaxID=2608880 RepID=UPI00129AC030|nr:SusD/RagB family nutrient-binding outer membrane lipoprotein [Foetidibacter luteolus]
MYKSKILSALLLFSISVMSCNKLKDFGDTNTNPNGVAEPNIAALLTNAEASLSTYQVQTTPGYYCQYFSETQYSDASLYSLQQINFTGEYAGILYDLQNITLQNNNNQSAVARILKAYIFWTVTDRWGDVPYSAALKGQPEPPVYDKQEDIYKGLIEELKAANAQFGGSDLIVGDIIFSGDIASWKRVANSLRMIMSMRLSKRYPGASDYAATEFKAALGDAAGYIATNSQNFTVDYPGGNFKSPWFNLYNGRKDVGESATMTALMTSLADGRQNAFASDVNGNPSAVGVPYGWTRDKVDPWTSGNPTWTYVLNASLRQENSSVVMIGAAHVALARAEAADRGWTSENMKAVYEDGIKKSFEQWGVNAPSASYFTQSNVALNAASGSGANIRNIALQRYIAFYPDGIQGWSEWRRTGVPTLTPAPDAVNASKQIPRRLAYGQNEYGSNAENVKKAVSELPGGADSQDAKVWWDQ